MIVVRRIGKLEFRGDMILYLKEVNKKDIEEEYDFLANGAGHIGYGIRKEFRGRGYASAGLKLALEKAWNIIQ